ncbi:MAG: TonB-dependent receptor, partial [Rhizobacter sp.]
MHSHSLHVLACAACLALAGPARAQSTAAASSTLPEVVITGNPLGASDIATPVSVLSGDELLLRRGSTLGDTLSSVPGVS